MREGLSYFIGQCAFPTTWACQLWSPNLWQAVGNDLHDVDYHRVVRSGRNLASVLFLASVGCIKGVPSLMKQCTVLVVFYHWLALISIIFHVKLIVKYICSYARSVNRIIKFHIILRCKYNFCSYSLCNNSSSTICSVKSIYSCLIALLNAWSSHLISGIVNILELKLNDTEIIKIPSFIK